MIYDLNIILQLLPFTPKDIENHTKYNLYIANFGSSSLSSALLGCHQEQLVISDSGDKGKQALFQEPSRHPTPPARQKCSWEKPQRGLLKKLKLDGGFVQDNVGAMVWSYGTVKERSFCPPNPKFLWRYGGWGKCSACGFKSPGWSLQGRWC